MDRAKIGRPAILVATQMSCNKGVVQVGGLKNEKSCHLFLQPNLSSTKPYSLLVLRKLARILPGHSVSVMVAGFSTDATWTLAGPIRDKCYSCSQSCVSSVQHALWECPDAALRLTPSPGSTLAMRLGWCGQSLGNEDSLLRQMGCIREADVAMHPSRAPWLRPP